MDESDADQILTIDELRSLRDRMGAEAAAPAPVASAAQFEIPEPSAGVPLDAPADPWEDLRRRASGQGRWAGRRWVKPLAAVGCLAIAGGGVAALVSTPHTTSVPPPPVQVSTPATPAPPVITTAPVNVLTTPEPSFVLPVPIVSPAPSPSAEVTTEPQVAAVPPPPATIYRPKPAKPPAARPSPAGVPGPAADQAGTPNAPAANAPAPNAPAEPQPTLSRTPTSWSPTAPG